jgi:hypothetical protein
MYKFWGMVSALATKEFLFNYKGDAVKDIKQEIFLETLEQLGRYATKNAHNNRVRYENVFERFGKDD